MKFGFSKLSIIVLLAIIVGAVLFYKNKSSAPPSLPADFVLETNARESYHQDNTIQATEFDTVKRRGELVIFYTEKLNEQGWVIIDSREIKTGFYLIVAEHAEHDLNINISITSQGGTGSNHVIIVLRNITGK